MAFVGREEEFSSGCLVRHDFLTRDGSAQVDDSNGTVVLLQVVDGQAARMVQPITNNINVLTLCCRLRAFSIATSIGSNLFPPFPFSLGQVFHGVVALDGKLEADAGDDFFTGVQVGELPSLEAVQVHASQVRQGAGVRSAEEPGVVDPASRRVAVSGGHVSVASNDANRTTAERTSIVELVLVSFGHSGRHFAVV